jgi:hypothetical protein
MTSNQKYMIFKINGSLVQAHRLVLMTWQPRKDMDKLTVDHINSNPRDNRLCNLEWVTEEENQKRAQENHIYTHSIGPLKEKTADFLAGKIFVIAKNNKDIVLLGWEDMSKESDARFAYGWLLGLKSQNEINKFDLDIILKNKMIINELSGDNFLNI